MINDEQYLHQHNSLETPQSADLIGVLDVDFQSTREIPYRPIYNTVTGSMGATILLRQIVYWWFSSGRKPFYKFKEPCGHSLYSAGDSWIEELCVGRREFEGALNRIATKIMKKDQYNQIVIDPDRNAVSLVNYWTDKDRLTWYRLNEEIYNNVMSVLYLKDKTAFTGKGQNRLYLKDKTAFTRLTKKNSSKKNSEKKTPLYPPNGGESSVVSDWPKKRRGGKSANVEPEYSEAFLKFWAIYPRKMDKRDAWKAWNDECCEEIADTVIASVPGHPLLKAEDSSKIKLPAGYIRLHRWEDELEPPFEIKRRLRDFAEYRADIAKGQLDPEMYDQWRVAAIERLPELQPYLEKDEAHEAT